MREARKDLLAEIDRCLGAAGFTRRAERLYAYDLGGGEVVGWLGLSDRPVDEGSYELFPHVGIHWPEFEDRLRKASHWKRSAFAGSVAVNLGYVMPRGEPISWTFDLADYERAANSLCATISDFGVPFMERLLDPPERVEALRRYALPGQRDYLLPTALLLVGRDAEARDSMEQAVRAAGTDREDAWGGFLRTFSDHLFSGSSNDL